MVWFALTETLKRDRKSQIEQFRLFQLIRWTFGEAERVGITPSIFYNDAWRERDCNCDRRSRVMELPLILDSCLNLPSSPWYHYPITFTAEVYVCRCLLLVWNWQPPFWVSFDFGLLLFSGDYSCSSKAFQGHQKLNSLSSFPSDLQVVNRCLPSVIQCTYWQVCLL